MNLQIVLDEQDLKRLVLAELSNILQIEINPNSVQIQVKSKQNFKSEWETASFRALIQK